MRLVTDLYEREARLIFGKANVIPTYRQVELLALTIERVAQQADTGNDSDYWIAVKAAATVRAQIGGSDLPNTSMIWRRRNPMSSSQNSFSESGNSPPVRKKSFKPLLAGKADLNHVRFPVLTSVKIDGVRAIVMDGVVMSRSLKPIPNSWVQRTFGSLPSGTDGELVFADPTHPDAYRNTVSAVMSEDGEPTEVVFHIFDNYRVAGGFAERFKTLRTAPNVEVVPHSTVKTLEELEAVEKIAVELGHEGVMLRDPNGPYKFGRSTVNEGYLLKVKRFSDMDAEVVGSYEWETNNNVATTNALGRTERSSHQENKVGAGVLGGLHVRGLEAPYLGVEFSVGTGFKGADAPSGERATLWAIRETLVGQICKVRYFATGSLERPRFPVMLGFRDDRDREVRS